MTPYADKKRSFVRLTNDRADIPQYEVREEFYADPAFRDEGYDALAVRVRSEVSVEYDRITGSASAAAEKALRVAGEQNVPRGDLKNVRAALSEFPGDTSVGCYDAPAVHRESGAARVALADVYEFHTSPPRLIQKRRSGYIEAVNEIFSERERAERGVFGIIRFKIVLVGKNHALSEPDDPQIGVVAGV